ncbi:hypothetical protein ACFQ1Q_04310 [Winogradskyella litorisediminis]|uniref:Uncharacterized protein n=1 Tax=Winogradskyella litorisediminis TaxID=1156618 RepID=A0ABW3N697_9FLAO
MKTLITTIVIISTLMLNSNFKVKRANVNEIKSTKATFDGAEGNFLFFTDINNKPLQFDNIDESVNKVYQLKKNKHIGDVFLVEFRESKLLGLKLPKTSKQ